MGCCNCCRDAGGFVAVLLRSDSTVFGPWIDREGDNLRATVDVVSLDHTTLTIRLFSKREFAVGDGTEVDITRTITTAAVGRMLQEWGPTTGTGLKTLVRYQFTATQVQPNPSATPRVIFRMLSPVWFDTLPTAAVTLPSSSGQPL